MSAPAVAGYPRFHAIVAAKPFHESVPPVIPPSQPETSYELYGGARFHEGKRRRDPSLSGGTTSNKKGPKRDADEEGGPCREVSSARDAWLGNVDLTTGRTAHYTVPGTRGTSESVEAGIHADCSRRLQWNV